MQLRNGVLLDQIRSQMAKNKGSIIVDFTIEARIHQFPARSLSFSYSMECSHDKGPRHVSFFDML